VSADETVLDRREVIVAGATPASLAALAPHQALAVSGGYKEVPLALHVNGVLHDLNLEPRVTLLDWDKQPKVQLQVRSPGAAFEQRFEEARPIPGTQWTKFHRQSEGYGLARNQPADSAEFAFRALGDGLTFLTEPMVERTEVTGPIAARLQISSNTTDADLFVVVRLFAPDMKEITFRGALDPHTPIAQGWLRASHRKLDPTKSLPYRPYHPHDEIQPLEPDKPYELDIEIWPTCIVVPKGYRIGLSVRGRDYVYTGGSGGRLSNMKNEFTGCGPFLHEDPRDRTMDRFNGETRIHIGEGRENYLLLPIIPAK
jgi:uncharacterized protein